MSHQKAKDKAGKKTIEKSDKSQPQNQKRKLSATQNNDESISKVRKDDTPKVKVQAKETMDSEKALSPLPTRNKDGELVFLDYPAFLPNLSPKEVLQLGSFGGTYFRPIYSSVTKETYSGVWKELPKDWLEGLDVVTQVASETYRTNVNKYNVKCGGSLEMWEQSGWMRTQDPYGWFQWYCRFYQGRRTEDDVRQVGRWQRCAGPTGRWRNNLISKCAKSGCAFDNIAISPVVRQTLQHWAYLLTEKDFKKRAKHFLKAAAK